MEAHKNITICIPIDVYNRVEKLCPKKKWGRNVIREFYTKIFLQGLESPNFLKAENRRLATKLLVTESLLGQPKAALAVESLAKDMETLQDMPAKQVETKPAAQAGPSSEEAAPSVALPNERKSTVH